MEVVQLRSPAMAEITRAYGDLTVRLIIVSNRLTRLMIVSKANDNNWTIISID